MRYDYDEMSPITNNKCVICDYAKDGNVSKLCMESGYTTSTFHKYNGDEDMESLLELKMPDILVKTKKPDPLGYTWYLSVIPTVPAVLTPFPIEGSWKWAVIPSKDGHGQKPALFFEQDDFSTAMDTLQRLVNESRIKHEEEE